MEYQNTFPLETNIWRDPYHLSSCLRSSGCVIMHADCLQGCALNWGWGGKGIAILLVQFAAIPQRGISKNRCKEVSLKATEICKSLGFLQE